LKTAAIGRVETGANEDPMTATDRLLVIDDDPTHVELVALVFDDYEVTTETSAPAALRRIAAGQRFDAIVCDVMMPLMTGPELHARLLQIAPDQADRVVFVTGGVSTAAAGYLARASNPILRKPVDIDELRETVRRIEPRVALAS
jgi:CheY-like chemotaxis protein